MTLSGHTLHDDSRVTADRGNARIEWVGEVVASRQGEDVDAVTGHDRAGIAELVVQGRLRSLRRELVVGDGAVIVTRAAVELCSTASAPRAPRAPTPWRIWRRSTRWFAMAATSCALAPATPNRRTTQQLGCWTR